MIHEFADLPYSFGNFHNSHGAIEQPSVTIDVQEASVFSGYSPLHCSEWWLGNNPASFWKLCWIALPISNGLVRPTLPSSGIPLTSLRVHVPRRPIPMLPVLVFTIGRQTSGSKPPDMGKDPLPCGSRSQTAVNRNTNFATDGISFA